MEQLETMNSAGIPTVSSIFILSIIVIYYYVGFKYLVYILEKTYLCKKFCIYFIIKNYITTFIRLHF